MVKINRCNSYWKYIPRLGIPNRTNEVYRSGVRKFSITILVELRRWKIETNFKRYRSKVQRRTDVHSENSPLNTIKKSNCSKILPRRCVFHSSGRGDIAQCALSIAFSIPRYFRTLSLLSPIRVSSLHVFRNQRTNSNRGYHFP